MLALLLRLWLTLRAKNYDAKGAADTALASAKAYADGLNTTMDGRVAAVETALEVGTF